MWWIALALTATQPVTAPERVRVTAAPQATATVRIVRFARVRMGEAATDPYHRKIDATETRFRDADGRYRPAQIVEFP